MADYMTEDAIMSYEQGRCVRGPWMDGAMIIVYRRHPTHNRSPQACIVFLDLLNLCFPR